MATRESGRIKEADKKRVLDDVSRRRRAKKFLEALEQDNYHDDPHKDLVMSKKVPKFHDSLDTTRSRKNKKTRGSDYYKAKYRKSFMQFLEEDKVNNPDGPSYWAAEAQPSKLPFRHFCAVCGFTSNYTCTSCGTRYCSTKCLHTHVDTRCLKYTA